MGVYSEDYSIVKPFINCISAIIRNYGGFGVNYRIDLENSDLNAKYECKINRHLNTIGPAYQDTLRIISHNHYIEDEIFYIDFYFDDIKGNKYKQTLEIDNRMILDASKIAEFKVPELINDK